ncbi:MAG: helix-turn-helix transcriptional regulator [Lachnospiraceae bacterium]|nr:helix-turn-helix transcriptional regulator [Lachnospiraceae bacterium]
MVSYDKLWKLLIDKHMSKTELRINAGLTTSALAQLGKNEYVSLKTIEKICSVLDCDIIDVVELRKN